MGAFQERKPRYPRKKVTEEVLYDGEAHRQFVTGFRKRKDERRKLAQQEIDEKNRKERLEKRKEKREMFKKIREANQASTGADCSSDDDEDKEDDDSEDERDKDEVEGEVIDKMEFQGAKGKGVVRVTVEQMKSDAEPYSPKVKPAAGQRTEMDSGGKGKSEAIKHTKKKHVRRQRRGRKIEPSKGKKREMGASGRKKENSKIGKGKRRESSKGKRSARSAR